MGEEEQVREWNGFHALLMWLMGIVILFTFGYVRVFNVWLSRILIEIFIFLIPVLVVYTIFNGTIKDLGFKRISLKEAALGILGGLAGEAVGYLSFELETLIIGGIPTSFIEYQAQFTPKTWLDLLIWLSFSLLLVGPSEELFSRGFIQKGLENTVGVVGGLILASALFGVLHFDVIRMFPTAMEGLVLGIVYICAGRKTSVSAISHGVLNSTIFLILFFLFPNVYIGL